jgi:hypothetical protein
MDETGLFFSPTIEIQPSNARWGHINH